MNGYSKTMAGDMADIKKVYFTVGEAALILGIEESCVRYWLVKFDMDEKVKRRSGKDRRLTVREINQLEEIKRLLKKEGYTILGAKKKLEGYRNDVDEIKNFLNPIP